MSFFLSFVLSDPSTETITQISYKANHGQLRTSTERSRQKIPLHFFYQNLVNEVLQRCISLTANHIIVMAATGCGIEREARRKIGWEGGSLLISQLTLN